MRYPYIFATAAMLAAVACSTNDLLIETETFGQKGGWVVDHEAFGKIQSAYIMAHGIGVPVADAATNFQAEPGVYNVWVSTYNWTAPWYDGKGPGAFSLSINGETVADSLGVSGDRWDWVKAGKVTLSQDNNMVLHDLSGFNGRADAILFTKSGRKPSYGRIKRNHDTDIADGYDLVVAGGGISGCATALAAARLGLKVAIVNNVPWLGGNIMYGVRASAGMYLNKYPELGNIVSQLIGARVEVKNDPKSHFVVPKTGISHPNPNAELPSWEEVEGNIASTPYIDAWNRLTEEEKAAITPEEADYLRLEQNRIRVAYVREKLLREAGVDIYAPMHIYKVDTDGRQIKSVTARSMNGGNDVRISGRLFADCTGDGDVAYLAGAEYMIGREDKAFAGEAHAPEKADMKMMGSTIYWSAFPRENPGDFPDVKDMPWAGQCDSTYHIKASYGWWNWETGLEINNAEEPELVRDNFLRCLFGNWGYIHNHIDKFKGMRLDYLNFIAAKRESRRFYGAHIVNETDVLEKVEYPDASFTATWPLDLHYAKANNAERFPGWEWMTYCTNGEEEFYVGSYDVPYRVLCCRDVDNLFLGGRSLSMTHLAMGTVRLQCTLGMAGEVTAMAARICKDHDAKPIDVYTDYLDELKDYMSKGAPLE